LYLWEVLDATKQRPSGGSAPSQNCCSVSKETSNSISLDWWRHSTHPGLCPSTFRGRQQQERAREGEWNGREERKNVAKLVGGGFQSGPRIALYRYVLLFLVLPRLPAIIFHIHYIYILVLRPPQWMRFRIPVNVSHCHILTACRRALTRHIRPDSPRWGR
jgi:hypothetical protein